MLAGSVDAIAATLLCSAPAPSCVHASERQRHPQTRDPVPPSSVHMGTVAPHAFTSCASKKKEAARDIQVLMEIKNNPPSLSGVWGPLTIETAPTPLHCAPNVRAAPGLGVAETCSTGSAKASAAPHSRVLHWPQFQSSSPPRWSLHQGCPTDLERSQRSRSRL